MSDFRDLEESVVELTGEVFGRDVTYTPAGGDPATIRAIFDYAFVESNGVQSRRPVLRIKLDDLDASPAKGDTVTVDDTDYQVTESHPDGYGGSVLILRKA